MQTNNTIKSWLAAALIGATGLAAAAPIEVTYTLAGTSGDWTLDFDVANNLGSTDQSVYFFGVDVGGSAVTGSPATFDATAYPSWNHNAQLGGADIDYTATWISGGHVILAGDDLGGFLVHSDAVDAPAGISWFVFTSGSEYLGAGQYFNNSDNPGWEGVATEVAAVPEPAPTALLLAGLGLLGVMARRRHGAI